MPIQPKNAHRQREMDQFLRECQAFTLLKQQGIITREVWQEWLRREYDIPIPEPVMVPVPDMRDLADHLGDRLQEMVDHRLAEIFSIMEEDDGTRVGAMIDAEQAITNGGPQPDVQSTPEVSPESPESDAEDVLSEDDIAALAEGDE